MAIENMKNGLYSAVTDLPDWYKIRYSYLFVPSNSGTLNGACDRFLNCSIAIKIARVDFDRMTSVSQGCSRCITTFIAALNRSLRDARCNFTSTINRNPDRCRVHSRIVISNLPFDDRFIICNCRACCRICDHNDRSNLFFNDQL